VAVAEATLAQAQATLSPLQKQLAVQRDLLTALIGRLPSQEPAERFEFATLPSYRHPSPQRVIAPIPYPRNPLITPPSGNS
jgi:outer membrane protein TolC